MNGATSDTEAAPSIQPPIAASAGVLKLVLQRFAGTQLRRNFLTGSGLTVATIASTAISYKVYLHFLGFDLYGLWLSLGFVLTLAQFGNLGITSAVSKIVAEENGRGDLDAVRSYVTTSILTLLVTGGILFFVVFLSRHAVLEGMRLRPEYLSQGLSLIPWLSLLSVYVLQVEVLNSVVYGLGRMDLAGTIAFCMRIFVVVVAIALLAMGHGIFSLLIANGVGAVAGHLANAIAIRRLTGGAVFQIRRFDVHRLRKMMTFSAGAFACAVVGMFLGPFNKFMLTRYGGLSLVPVYEIATSLAMQARGLLDNGLRAIVPEVSRLQGHGTDSSWARIQAIHERSLKVALIIGVLICVPAMLLAGLALRLWLGSRFHPLMPGAVRVLLAANFLSLFGLPAYNALFAIGRLKTLLFAQSLQAIINVVTVIAVIASGATLSPLWAAAASGSGLVVAGFYLLAAWRRKAA